MCFKNYLLHYFLTLVFIANLSIVDFILFNDNLNNDIAHHVKQRSQDQTANQEERNDEGQRQTQSNSR